MTADATTRFSARVSTYVRFRPGYPATVAELLGREANLDLRAVIADMGCGTGLLAKVLLDAGFQVIGVEPNREMREAGDELLRGFPAFRSIDGRAENTGLSDCSIDLITAGQAFHWFDIEKTRREWVRILKPGGMAALIWNEKFVEPAFMREIENVIDIYAAEADADGSIREAGRGSDRERIAGFFAPDEFRLDEFPNHQLFDLEALLGRVESSSYVPLRGQPGYDEMARDVTRVFDRWQRGGKVKFEYRTRVYRGRLAAV